MISRWKDYLPKAGLLQLSDASGKIGRNIFWDGWKKKKDCFSVETLVLRHRQEIESLTVSRLHVSHASRVLCGFSTGLLIYRFEVRFPLNAQVLSLLNRVPTQTFFHYNPPIVLLCLKYYWLGARRCIDKQWKWHRELRYEVAWWTINIEIGVKQK